jgi:hypothetical protein
MTQPCTNWLRPPKGKQESQSPEMKGRMNAARKVEKKKEASDIFYLIKTTSTKFGRS